MSKSRLAWAAGIAVLLLLLLLGCGWYLKQRYCWGCTAEQRYLQAEELLCRRDAGERSRGLAGLSQLAQGGMLEPLALLSELTLQPLPGRFALIRRDLFACAEGKVPVNRLQALDNFRQLAASDGLSPEMEYNLGVLVEDRLLESGGAVRSALDYFQRAAARGEYRAMYELGLRADAQKDYIQAARWFDEAFSRGGHPGAALMLGDYAVYGRLGAVDVDNGLVWYQKALTAAAPGAEGNVAELARQAQNRLAIARGTQARRGGEEIPTLSYRLAGGLDEYRIYAAESQELLGRVLRTDAGGRAQFGPEGAVQEQEVSSMNAGLSWILDAYAATLYGAGQKVRFVLAADPPISQ